MNKKNKIFILIIIVTTIVIASWSISKYKSTAASADTARAAVPVITLNELNPQALSIAINPADSIPNYIFEIANYNGNKESEVSMEYSIKINNSNNLPLKYSIYTYNEETKSEEGENLLLENKTTAAISMPVGNKQASKYVLKIDWEEGKDSYLYSKEIDYVQIIVNSRQID